MRVERSCRGGFHVAHLNLKTSCVSVYKCLLLIVGFAVTVAIWPREVVSCGDFILHAVAISYYDMSLVRIYPGRASVECLLTPTDSHNLYRPSLQAEKISSLNNEQCFPKGNKNLTFSLFSRM